MLERRRFGKRTCTLENKFSCGEIEKMPTYTVTVYGENQNSAILVVKSTETGCEMMTPWLSIAR